jgi:hypothetical protein
MMGTVRTGTADLTAERLARLILSINSRRIVERSRENRAEQRNGVRYRIMIKVIGPQGTKTHRAWIRNFSNTGLGIAASIHLPSGQKFTLQLPSDAGLVEIPCATAHSRRVAEDMYNIGVRFVDAWYKQYAEAA